MGGFLVCGGWLPHKSKLGRSGGLTKVENRTHALPRICLLDRNNNANYTRFAEIYDWVSEYKSSKLLNTGTLYRNRRLSGQQASINRIASLWTKMLCLSSRATCHDVHESHFVPPNTVLAGQPFSVGFLKAGPVLFCQGRAVVWC